MEGKYMEQYFPRENTPVTLTKISNLTLSSQIEDGNNLESGPLSPFQNPSSVENKTPSSPFQNPSSLENKTPSSPFQTPSSPISILKFDSSPSSILTLSPKSSQIIESSPEMIESSLKSSQIIESSPKIIKSPYIIIESQRKIINSSPIIIESSKSSQIIESSPEIIESSLKSSQIIKSSPKSSQIIDSSPISSQIIELPPKSSKINESPKVIESPSKSSQIINSSPKSSQIIESPPKSQIIKSSPKVIESPPKSSQIIKSSPKVIESPPKSSQIIKSSPKVIESPPIKSSLSKFSPPDSSHFPISLPKSPLKSSPFLAIPPTPKSTSPLQSPPKSELFIRGIPKSSQISNSPPISPQSRSKFYVKLSQSSSQNISSSISPPSVFPPKNPTPFPPNLNSPLPSTSTGFPPKNPTIFPPNSTSFPHNSAPLPPKNSAPFPPNSNSPTPSTSSQFQLSSNSINRTNSPSISSTLAFPSSNSNSVTYKRSFSSSIYPPPGNSNQVYKRSSAQCPGAAENFILASTILPISSLPSLFSPHSSSKNPPLTRPASVSSLAKSWRSKSSPPHNRESPSRPRTRSSDRDEHDGPLGKLLREFANIAIMPYGIPIETCENINKPREIKKSTIYEAALEVKKILLNDLATLIEPERATRVYENHIKRHHFLLGYAESNRSFGQEIRKCLEKEGAYYGVQVTGPWSVELGDRTISAWERLTSMSQKVILLVSRELFEDSELMLYLSQMNMTLDITPVYMEAISDNELPPLMKSLPRRNCRNAYDEQWDVLTFVRDSIMHYDFKQHINTELSLFGEFIRKFTQNNKAVCHPNCAQC